jgi:hemerythrin superfamily protein
MNVPNAFSKLSPSITGMIRMDHSHVLVTFHKYTVDAPAGRKKAIVNAVCLALEIHAQLEEEIFYPAMRQVDDGSGVLAKSRPEHDEMRRLIASLRAMEPGDAGYDDTFFELLRDVIHHVADEETVLLPAAERRLKERLSELGAQMTQRRLQLVAPHTGEMVVNTARAMPAATLMTIGAILGSAIYLARRAGNRTRAIEYRRGPPPADHGRLVDLHQPELDSRHLTHVY